MPEKGAPMSYEETTANANWTTLETYVAGARTYELVCPPDRLCQVGMGLFLKGPLGEKVRFSNRVSVTAVGAGRLVVRVVDGKGSCPIRWALKDSVLIPLFRGGDI